MSPLRRSRMLILPSVSTATRRDPEKPILKLMTGWLNFNSWIIEWLPVWVQPQVSSISWWSNHRQQIVRKQDHGRSLHLRFRSYGSRLFGHGVNQSSKESCSRLHRRLRNNTHSMRNLHPIWSFDVLDMCKYMFWALSTIVWWFYQLPQIGGKVSLEKKTKM